MGSSGVEMTAEESETAGLIPKLESGEPTQEEEAEVEDAGPAPKSGGVSCRPPQLLLDAPLPPTIDDDDPPGYWGEDDSMADELEAPRTSNPELGTRLPE
ncbi:unnamed protein product [Symbiodinium natans]|uniref:Uncharacterized protein n=1 Tax=Symbiodinium natans TaxID=878477 RepID=A0A812RW69_9DINO|nr:unnamed protein product [Symbiodinium natans]